MTNLDLFDAGGAPPATSPAQRAWACATIDAMAASGDRITVVKNLKKRPDDFEKLVDAVVLVAQRKALAYGQQMTAVQACEALSGWLTRDADLALATGVVTACRLPVSELPPLPAGL
ncbi:hypothetical protein F6X40_27795 [Paraburkholderia sp. UCT31]|uniref:hypothetical protein n=1 Tax=Paraburkholderia sp. UCT31 TaxID=2615209 RepID=UPI001656412B|nr:hypothetical protein [Paraburkholderia sp. UCT31]MBC8740443.1 hypothetical protein [Paraburkholderia sp. UCT31]